MVNYNEEDLKEHQGVAAIIRNEEGKFLMQHHVKFGFWTIPIGKCGIDEDSFEGMELEVFEETNLEVLLARKICIYPKEYNRNGVNVLVVCTIFKVLTYRGELMNKEPEKHYEQKWMTYDEICKFEHLSDATIEALPHMRCIADENMSETDDSFVITREDFANFALIKDKDGD